MSKKEKFNNFNTFQSMNSMSTQGLNEAIKSRKRGRVFFKVLMVILALVLIGGGIAIYFILSRKPKIEGVELSVDVWMVEYPTNQVSYKNTYTFLETDSSMSYGAEDEMSAELSGLDGRIEILYGVFNNSGKTYNFSLQFDELKKDGFLIEYYVDYESEKRPIPEDGKITLQKGGNFVIAVIITLKSLAENAVCEGNITMDISII